MTDTKLEILREELPCEQFVGAGVSQAVVEGEVALPGGLREETHVLSCEAMAALERSQAEAGRVLSDGRVTFHVLYTQGDPTHVSALEASAEFSHASDVPGAQSGMSAPVSLMVEHVEASAQGGRLHLMAILRVQCRVFSDEPVSVVTGVRGMDGLMVQSETIPTLRVCAMGKQDALIRDECDLPSPLQVEDTLYATAIATVHDVMGGEGRAAISGQVDLEVTHLSAMPLRPVVVTRHSIPFEESVALSGEMGDSLICSAAVRDVAVLSQEAADGERTLRAEVLLDLSAHSTREKEVVLIKDAYTTQGEMLSLSTREVSRATAHRQLHTAESGKLTLMLDGEAPVRTPLRAVLAPVVTDFTQQNGKLYVEGMMDVTLLYMTDDDPVPRSFRTEEPFRMAFACQPSLPESLRLTPGSVDVSAVTSDRVEVKYILHLDLEDVELRPGQMVEKVDTLPAQEEAEGILLCFAKEGETLWDIAKRYRVSSEEIKRLNPEENPKRVLVWKR